MRVLFSRTKKGGKTIITVSITKNSIHVHGHAGAGPPGQDIVCASVSILAQNLISSIEDLTEDKITYSVSPGMVDIDYRELSEASKLLVDSFFIGICGIENSYPEYVRVQ